MKRWGPAWFAAEGPSVRKRTLVGQNERNAPVVCISRQGVNTDQTNHEYRADSRRPDWSRYEPVGPIREMVSLTRATLGDHEVLLRRALIEEAAKTRTTIMERMDRCRTQLEASATISA